MADRAILHVDMDAFFASIEQLDQPALRGKPVLVGGAGPRGVVAAASYEARAFGCHSAQPMAVARRCCPQAIITPPHGERYHEVSDRLFEILESFTTKVRNAAGTFRVNVELAGRTGTATLNGGMAVARGVMTLPDAGITLREMNVDLAARNDTVRIDTLSMVSGERLDQRFSATGQIVRPFNAYGPGELPDDEPGIAHAVPDLIRKVLSGQRPLQIFGLIGLASAAVGALITGYLGYVRLIALQPIAERAPLLLFGVLLIFTGVQLVTFGLLAELLARTYYESQNKPVYAIREIRQTADLAHAEP